MYHNRIKYKEIDNLMQMILLICFLLPGSGSTVLTALPLAPSTGAGSRSCISSFQVTSMQFIHGYWAKGSCSVSVLFCLGIIVKALSLQVKYWVGKKVCLGFSVTSYGIIQMNFLTKPIQTKNAKFHKFPKPAIDLKLQIGQIFTL